MLTLCDRCTIPSCTTVTSCTTTCCSSSTKESSNNSIRLYDSITEFSQECDGVTVAVSRFCSLNTSVDKVEENVKRITFTTMNNLEVSIISLGARIVSLKIPGVIKAPEEILLGFTTIDDYQTYQDFNIGGLIGKLKRSPLALDYINFESYISCKCELVLSCVIREYPEVYPCDLMLQIKFIVCKNNTITIDYMARVARPVLFNIGYRLYMNLCGFDCEKDEIKRHVVFINSEKFYDEDSKLIMSVDDTPFDLRIPLDFETIMGEEEEFNQIYMLDRNPKESLTFVSRVIEPNSGRVIEIYTNQPSCVVKATMSLPPCKIIEEAAEQEDEEIEQGDEDQECGECENTTVPTIIQHSNFPHCFLKTKLKINPNDDIVKSRGCKKTDDTCSERTDSGECEDEDAGPSCVYERCGFLFQTSGMPPKSSILKPGEEYHHIVLYKFGFYCPMEPPDDDSCCSDTYTGATATTSTNETK